jgi:LPXTG-site transpeptidase (sortase) family protein
MGHTTALAIKCRQVFFVIFLALVLFFSSPGLIVQAATTGPNAPTAYTNNNSVGNPERAYTSNGSYAQFNSGSDRVDYITFGFTGITSGSTIDGIVVNLEGYRDNTSTRVFTVQVSTNGGTTWTTAVNSPTLTTSDTTVQVGSSTNNLGLTTTFSTNANFRIRVGATSGGNNIYLDYVDVTLFYTLPDTTPPSVTVEQASTQSDPTRTSPIHYTVTFSEPINPTTFTGADMSLSSTGTGTLSATLTEIAPNNDTTWDVAVSGMTSSGRVTASLPASRVTDVAGNNNTASSSSDNAITYDITAPSVISIHRFSPLTYATNADSIIFQVVFSENITNIGINDFSISGTTATITNITGSGTTFNLTISGGDLANLNNVVDLSIAAAPTIYDLAGNSLPTGEPSDHQTYTIDNIAPEIISITRSNPSNSPTNANYVIFQVLFSEAILNGGTNDLSLVTTSSAIISSVIVDTTWTILNVTVSGGNLTTYNGSVGLNLAPVPTITDIAGNPLPAGEPSIDEIYVIDNLGPQVTVNQASTQLDPTNTGPVHFTVVFNEPINTTTLTNSDITLGGTLGGTSVSSITQIAPNDGTTFDASVNVPSGNGTVTASIPATRVADLAGNNNGVSTSTDNSVTLDTVSPTVTLVQASTQADPTGTSPIHFTATFSENIDPASFISSDLTLGGTATGTLSAVITETTPNRIYDIAVSGMTGDGTVTASLAAGVVTDRAGNLNSASTGADNTVTYDVNPPVLASILRSTPATSPTNADTLIFAIAFTENVQNVDGTDFVVTGSTATITGYSGSGDTYYLTVSGGNLADLDGVVGLALAASPNITDLVGNGLYGGNPTGANNQTYTLDNTNPSVVSFTRHDPSETLTNADTLVFYATFSEEVVGVGTGDFEVTGGTSNITGVSQVDTTTWQVTVSGGSLAGYNGSVGINLNALATIEDTVGNILPILEPLTDETYMLDNTVPSIIGITRFTPSTSPTNADSLIFQVTFSEGISAISILDFAVNGTTTATVSGITMVDATTYQVTVSGGDLVSFNGVVGLNLSASQGILDNAGNALPAGEPSTDETYTVDNVSPDVTIEQAASQDDPTSTLPINFTVVFDEPIDDVTLSEGDFTLGGTATGTLAATVTEIAPMDKTTFNVAVSGVSGDGTVTVAMAADAVQDPAGNGNTTSTSSDNSVTFDGTVPSISSIQRYNPTNNPTNADALVFRVVFSEEVNNVGTDDFTVSGFSTAVVGMVTYVDAVTYDITVSGGDLAGYNGEVGLNISAGQNITDTADNALSFTLPATNEMYTVDNHVIEVMTNGLIGGPGVTIITDGGAYTTRFSSIQVNFSEDAYDPAGNSDPDDVTNPENYLLVQPGVDGEFDTDECDEDIMDDDVQIPTGPVVYSNAGGVFVADVTINGGASLPFGEYRLLICGSTSIQTIAGTPLNNGVDTITDFALIDVTQSELPATGFAPGVITALPQQTVDYTGESGLWIEIPSLNVSEEIVGVPLDDSQWDVTWLNDQIGWLQGTTYPTWDGNSALTGHVYDSNGLPGPFVNLGALRYGDTIIIHLNGQQYIYSVRSTMSVSPSSTYWLTRHEDYSWLTLVTCQHYNEASNSYDYRRVVRAVLVDVIPED